MSDVAFALREYAGLTWPTMNHKGRMAQLARRLGLGHRRIRAIYQNEPGVALRADEAAAIAALRQEQRAAEHDYADLESRLARLEAFLTQRDEDFHRLQVDALRAAANDRRPVND